ncbi:hypothetical protein KVR01_012057 [Diaporthe batatas]|uniref:uncharacterized protein n=1 Tax=Diaporthe batatas TaxID=748121 RepID=UPI001D051024|nr:uncharacterized protein KVR01_012057 [Diaporthe batatas]KAG8158296.1 hypothetical protein KVR01_012057 [Diaporthe batatas]
MTKQELTTNVDAGLDTDQDASSIVKEIYRGTSADKHDMDVLGVKQVLRRNYRLVPMLGFSSIAVISWEIAPILLGYVLIDGGPAAMFWAAVSFAVILNTALASRLPVIQYFLFALHFGGIFAIVLPLWLTADHGNSSDVLFGFYDRGNWGNEGLSSMIGLVLFAGLLNGYDCIAHMSEETIDASRIIPIAITWSVSYNVVALFIICTAMIFCIGDIESLLTTSTGQPFIQLFYNATQSYCCVINEVATSSRQLWSFARDRGLPGSTWLSHVAPGLDIPLRSICLTVFITVLLSLINLGSTVALQAANSLGGVAFLFSYVITLLCLIWRRIWGAPLPARRWSLGRYGLVINLAALVFLIPTLFFYCWPLAQPVTAINLNWSSVAFALVLLVALVYYFIKARHEYVGPVMRVKRD